MAEVGFLKGSVSVADDINDVNSVELATELTIAWLANPNTRVASDDVPAFLKKMHDAVQNLSATPEAVDNADAGAGDYVPAVSVRKSLASKDHIISMIDGKAYKTLRRHLAGHGLTPDDYRQRYGLKADYPMVAETYSQARRDMAKKIGLGRKGGRGAADGAEAAVEDAAPVEAPAKPARRGRKAAASASAED